MRVRAGLLAAVTACGWYAYMRLWMGTLTLLTNGIDS